MTTYIDAAILVKGYVLEANSEDAIRILDEVGEPFAFSHLHHIEIPNAIRLKRFRREISPAQEQEAIRMFRADMDAGRFQRIDYDLSAVFSRAERISARLSGALGTRSLDLWHVAAALEAGFTAFASYDARQRKAAVACQLRIIPD